MNPAQCNICEKAAAKFHCNNCGDALCPQCKVHHLKSKGTKHHKIVPYAEKLNPKYITDLLCPKHQTHAPKFWCKTCSVPICDSCVVTNEHKGHEFSDITAILSEKRDEMLAEMKMLRDVTVEEWEEVLKTAQGITTDFLGSIDELEKELVSRAKEMHREVEAILSQSQNTLQQMKTAGLAKLRRQEKNLEDQLHQLKGDVEQYENQLRDADPNTLIQFKQSTGLRTEKKKPPALETLSAPVLTKGQNDSKAMQNIFGELSTGAILQKSREFDEKYPSCHSGSKSDRASDSDKTLVPSSHLIPNPSVQFKFEVQNGCPHIACLDKGLAWVHTFIAPLPSKRMNKRTKLQLVNRDGSVKDTISTDFSIKDMAVTSDGDLLLTDYKNKCIKSVSQQKTISTLFTTSWTPCGLCCLHNDNIVVEFRGECKVIMYNRDGKIRQTLDHIKLRCPRKVAVNRVNQDIYICDRENIAFDSAGKVIAVGADDQLKYEYTGQSDSKFTPEDMCTDQMGHILITDYNNHRVHMLDRGGRFMQYVLTEQQGLYRPTTIDVDREGYLWVGEEVNVIKGSVKVAKYLQ